jgi:transcriptional regulator with XRE-family HTH domain
VSSQDHHAEMIVRLVVKRLTEARVALGMSKNRLAVLAGIDPKAVAFIEKGERSPTLHTLAKMARALDVSLGTMVSDAEREIGGP